MGCIVPVWMLFNISHFSVNWTRKNGGYNGDHGKYKRSDIKCRHILIEQDFTPFTNKNINIIPSQVAGNESTINLSPPDRQVNPHKRATLVKKVWHFNALKLILFHNLKPPGLRRNHYVVFCQCKARSFFDCLDYLWCLILFLWHVNIHKKTGWI